MCIFGLKDTVYPIVSYTHTRQVGEVPNWDTYNFSKRYEYDQIEERINYASHVFRNVYYHLSG